MAYGESARGLGDLRVAVLGAADAPGSLIDVPGIGALEWSADSETDELAGDNQIIAVAQSPKSGTGTLTLGRMSPTALAAMLGGTATTTGVTPDAITTYEESGAANVVYIEIQAQTPSADLATSAYRVTLHKAQMQSPSESLGQNEWNTPTMGLQFLPNAAGKFITREWYENEEAIA